MVLTDTTDFSHSYDIVLKYTETPSWYSRIITTVFPGVGSHLKGKWVCMGKRTQKLLFYIFYVLDFFLSVIIS